MKGEAIRITGPRKYEMVGIESSEPGPGEVLLEMLATGVCNQHDAYVFERGWPGRKYPLEPGFPGHEGAGIVVKIGPGVEGISAGTLAAACGLGGPPLYRRLVVRKASDIAPVGSGTPPEFAAAIELYGCVLHALSKTDVRGRRAAVIGMGPAGMCCVQLLKALGASFVSGFEIDPVRLRRAALCGADRIVDARPLAKAFAAADRAAIEGRGALSSGERSSLERLEAETADLVVECTGDPVSSAASFFLAGREIIFFGFCRDKFSVNQMPWFEKELVIRNSKRLSPSDLSSAARLLSDGAINPAPIVTHRLPARDYGEALALISRREAVKVVLLWN
jgi:2-desacetyl-2-hydroxyethyl bacteriochlorophyllide A dehydrogenase